MLIWYQINRFILYVVKTEIVKLDNIQRPEEVKISGGCSNDNRLYWHQQVGCICSKLSSSYFAVLKLMQSVSKQVLFIQWFIQFCVSAWFFEETQPLFVIAQKRIIWQIFNLKPMENCRPIYKKKGILTITSIFVRKSAVFAITSHEIFHAIKNFTTTILIMVMMLNFLDIVLWKWEIAILLLYKKL